MGWRVVESLDIEERGVSNMGSFNGGSLGWNLVGRVGDEGEDGSAGVDEAAPEAIRVEPSDVEGHRADVEGTHTEVEEVVRGVYGMGHEAQEVFSLVLTFGELCEALPELELDPLDEGWDRYEEILLSEEGGEESALQDTAQQVFAARKYKKVADRVKPLLTDLPDQFRIVRREHPDPLADLPEVPEKAPPFSPGQRFTQERYDEMRAQLIEEGFLWEDEIDIVLHMVFVHEMGFAWNEMERGVFDPKYFDPIRIPTVPHKPWVVKNIRIPPGLLPRLIEILKGKMAAGVYEPSNASYRSPWFTVAKKDGSLRMVHNLQPLNKVAIRDMGVPPHTQS